MRSLISLRHGYRMSIRPSTAAIAMVSLTIVALATGAAHAQDWRYCLAPLHAEHKVYMSAPFVTAKSMERLQDEFASALSHAGLRHGAVQCPRGDERSIAAMRLQAVRFNRDSGNAVVDFDHWSP
ncbi:MAG TPA: hypothetical protein VGG01_07395 [Xanthobacteraceae bacterium]